MFTEQQIIALSESIEHWYTICTTDFTEGWEIPIGSLYCTCCNYFIKRICLDCPIFGYTGRSSCDGTPYLKCEKAAHNFNEDQEEFYKAAVEEYQFLIEVMCSEDPYD